MQRLNVEKVQRPRRTSEFHEEPGTAAKRQSRIQRRGTNSTEHTPTHAGTAQKFSTRQRTSATGSTTRARPVAPTPQKTPLQSARVLFTAEKQRLNAGVALHNDKKWIQDQTQRITDYLKKSWVPGGMNGIAEDFFARPNCLKQMSIKQFVSIINYFLHFIWGNRFTVGSNHVEDIVNILQKLGYPHQVNKSWLKTPNTTHSFGNVIVLFDFLMDFVPTECEFPLELQESTTELDELEPDLEFKAELLQNCQQSFFMWDKQLDEDFEEIKRQTIDLLVKKRCGVAGLDALDMELKRLYRLHETLQNQRPHIAPKDERECARLREFIKNTHGELEQLCEATQKYELQLEQILTNKRICIAEIQHLKNENIAHQKAIREQICNVKQRDAFVEELKTLRLELQCHKRTVDELQQRDYRQQVQLSLTKKNVTEEIENLNTLLRELTFTLGIADPQHQLQISLNADTQSVERLIPQLKAFQQKTMHDIKGLRERLQECNAENEKLNFEMAASIEPHIKAQEATLTTFLKRHAQLQQHISNEFEVLYARQQGFQATHNELQMEIELQEQQILNTQQAIQQIENDCEELMSKAEKEHSASVEERQKYLDEFESSLNMCVNRLRELEEIVSADKENTPPKVVQNHE